MKIFLFKVLLITMFYMVCIPTKIPHSKVPPWVTIERDLKINLEDC